jgi:hypothetical protein
MCHRELLVGFRHRPARSSCGLAVFGHAVLLHCRSVRKGIFWRLTFDLSGPPKAGPLEGRVRRHWALRCRQGGESETHGPTLQDLEAIAEGACYLQADVEAKEEQRQEANCD